MPWRNRPTPYAVWVSEIMLQQTQVATVTPFFLRFMKRFPSLKKLAAADLQDVLKVWEGLGYYSRARNLRRAAQEITDRHKGRMPRTAQELQALPGIGPYTAAAIAAISFGERIPVVDGNVVRVFARFLAIATDSAKPRVKKEIAAYLAGYIPESCPGDFAQAGMELGALVCHPRKPDCAACPLRRRCVAFQTHRVHQLPVRPKRKPIPHYTVVACVIRKGKQVLITRRRADQMLGGLWEFPGGKQWPRETLAQTAVREIREELGIDIEAGRTLCVVKHAYSHFRITLHAIECRRLKGRPKALVADAARWEFISRLDDYPFPAADRQILNRLRNPDSIANAATPRRARSAD